MALFIPSLQSLLLQCSSSPDVLQYVLLDRIGEGIKGIVIPADQRLDLVVPPFCWHH